MEKSELEESIRVLLFKQMAFEIKNDPCLSPLQKTARMKGLRCGVENTSMEDALEYLTITKSYNLIDIEASHREIDYRDKIIEENGIR